MGERSKSEHKLEGGKSAELNLKPRAPFFVQIPKQFDGARLSQRFNLHLLLDAAMFHRPNRL